jgi:phthalate 4,5-cis-dihydrodiol dehydrogenase
VSERKLRVGVAGLGKAFGLMLPTLERDPRVELVAAADPRPEATRRFAAELGARAYDSVEALCADRSVDLVYIATPHQHHAEHAILAAGSGKHVLVEKPMAISMDECRLMIDAARRAGVVLVVGHSHGFDRPILRAHEIVASGAVGAVGMVTAQYYTDFLYRPRRPEELDTARGGGVVFSQAAHQVDIVRLLAGGRVERVRAATGAWDPARRTEGAYAALLTFAGGVFASLVYSGYAHFDGDEFCGGISELGQHKDARAYGSARRTLQRASEPQQEAALKQARNYGGAEQGRRKGDRDRAAAPRHEHFGLVLVSCERADLRPLPDAVMIYGDREVRVEPVAAPEVPRAEVIDELYRAIVEGRAPLHDGRWGMATLEVCLAILESARSGADVELRHQVAVPL